MIETSRLTLRPPRLADLDGFAAFYMGDRAGFVGGPVASRDDAWRIFAALAGHWHLRGWGPWAVAMDGRAIGHCGPWWPDGGVAPELGWALWDEALEGRGLMREAAAAARADAWARGVGGLVSYVHPQNARSRDLARRLGARRDPAALATEPGLEVWRHPEPGTRPEPGTHPVTGPHPATGPRLDSRRPAPEPRPEARP